MSATKHPEKSKTKLGTPFVTSTMGLPHAVIVIAYGIDTYVVGVWSNALGMRNRHEEHAEWTLTRVYLHSGRVC